MKSITAMYAGMTMLLFAGLSAHVSKLRIDLKTKLGDNSDPRVLRAARAQGNCAEYIAVLFLMLLIAEFQGGNKTVLHIFGGSILAARALHAYGMLATQAMMRTAGATINYLMLFGLPSYVLYLRFK